MENGTRVSGIECVGSIPWGTHLCQFYESKQDLIDVLVSYFRAGLESNEFCMWVTSQPLTAEEAEEAAREAMPEFDRYLRRGQMEILSYADWYLQGGVFDSRRVLDGWVEKLNQAQSQGFAGLRLTGNTFWLERASWQDFVEYEEQVDRVIGSLPMIALCSYSLQRCGGSDVLDVLRNHRFALIRRRGGWELVESSELKRAKEALEESEARFRRLAENAPDIVFRYELSSGQGLSYVSPAVVETLGFEPAELYADPDILLNGVPPYHRKAFQKLTNGPALSEPMTISCRHKKGHKLWLELRVVPIHDDSGRLVALEGIARDITGRRRAEDELRETRDYLEKLVNYANAPIIVWDPAFKITRFNRAFERLTSYESDEVLGKELAVLFPAASREESLEKIARTLTGEHWESVEIPILRKDGETRVALWNSANIYAEDGETLLATIAQGQDITERKQAEEELRKLSRAMEQSPATVVITDIRGNIEYANPKFLETTGYTPEEALGKNPRILKSGYTSAEDYRDLWKTIKAGGEWRGEFLNKKKDGELYWESASISPIRDSDGTILHFLAVKEDITERKRAEEEIRKLNADLTQRAQELDAINKELESFSYSVSHDLRAPLRGIDGFSQALLEEYGERLDEQGKQYLQRVRAASQRMARLIDDMLTLSRVTRRDMVCEEMDLSALAQEAAADLRKAEPERQVEFVIEPGVVARGDARLLGAVLENLLGNAWKFTAKHPRARIEFGSTLSGGERAYFVRDDGAGFDMAYADKLFGAFQRLHSQNEFPGSGVGLATVQRIIRRHGGRVWAEGAPEQGATLYFTLGSCSESKREQTQRGIG